MNDCLFCKIAAGTIPSRKAYEDERVLVFEDIDPQAPVHLLAIPKAHIRSVADISRENSADIAWLLEVVARVAAEQKLDDGFRVVSNIGEFGQQSVEHLHFHILGGRQMAWPPG